MFDKALKCDSTFTLAYIGLADIYTFKHFHERKSIGKTQTLFLPLKEFPGHVPDNKSDLIRTAISEYLVI